MADEVCEERRGLFDKEHFLEGHRQKWAGIFVVLGIATMILSAYGWIKDPAPFLGYFTGIGVTFILGASGSEIMKAYKVESAAKAEVITDNQNRKSEEEIKVKVELEKELEVHIREEGVNAPLVKPFAQQAAEEGDGDIEEILEETNNGNYQPREEAENVAGN